MTAYSEASDHRRKLNYSASSIALCIFLTAAQPARSQEQPAAAARSTFEIEEVVVTARKRTERLQDIPLAVSALGTFKLERMGADSFEEYARAVPSLSFASAGPSRSKIFMRGVSDGQSAVNTEASVGVYIDEQPVTMGGQQPDLSLFDVDRVEVLRGPQGTLYGASSQGGTIRIITNKPDPTGIAAKLDGTVSTTRHGDESYELNAMANVPVVEDKFALRVVGVYRDDGGFIDNIFGVGPDGEIDNSQFVEDDVNREETKGGRIMARLTPNDKIDATASFLYEKSDLEGLYDYTPDTGDLQQVRFAEEGVFDELWQANLTINADIGFADLVSATSYFDRKLRYDSDNTDYLANNPYYDFGPGPSFYTFRQRQETFTQEVRLSSKPGNKLDWLIGAFYMDRKDTSGDLFVAPGIASSPAGQFYAAYYDITLADEYYVTDNHSKQEQIAVFGELNYHITDKLEASVGLRWFHVKQNFDSVLRFLVFDSDDMGSSSESGLNPKFLVNYNVTEDALLYATVAKGFRVGGSNGTLPPGNDQFAEYEADKLWNYEIGAKTSFWDNRLTFNIAAFYMDWTDIQVDARPQGIPRNIVLNAGKAEVKGFEIESIVIPIENLELSTSISYNDAQLAADSPELNAPQGSRLASVPDFTFYASANYTIPIDAWGVNAYVWADFSHVGDSVNRVDPDNQLVQPAYEIVNARIGIDSGTWEAAVFVDNVFDERAVLLINNFFRDNRVTPNRPRTIGINLKTTF